MAQRRASKTTKLQFLDMLTMELKLVPVTTQTPKITTVCPKCPEPTGLPLVYSCDTHGTFSQSEMHRAIVVNKGLHRLSDAEDKALKGRADESDDDAPEELPVQVVPADQFMSRVIPASNFYRLRPTGAFEVYTVLLEVIGKRSDLAFIVEIANRGAPALYRIVRWDPPTGSPTLAAQQFLRPNEVDAGEEEYRKEFKPEILDYVTERVDAAVSEFDTARYDSVKIIAAEAVVADKTNPKIPAVGVNDVFTETAPPADDMLSALEAAAKASKAKVGDLTKLTVAELREQAAGLDLEVPAKVKKKDLIDLITKAA